MIDTRKYTFTFFVTVAIFATAFFASTFFSNKRVENVKFIQDNIAIDILSSETQFDLLKEVSCQNVSDSMLSPELNLLGDKLSHTENERGEKDDDVIYLKKYYSLLQVKDYLLSKKLAEKCGALKKPVFIIYFYSNQGDCPDCQKEGYVLTRLKEKYPELRVYSFDYNLQLSVIDSLKAIYRITNALPALVIEDKTYTGFKSVEDLEALLPDTLKEATTTSLSSSTLRKGK
jgi:thiol-disulfide isomerase/thioredoxin